MLESKVGELVGTGARPIRWERPLLFFLALGAADLVWYILSPSFFSLGQDEGRRLTFFNIPPPLSWLEGLAYNALIVVLAAAVFLLVRNVFAILPIAIIYGLLSIGLQYLFTLTYSMANPPPFWDAYRVVSLVNNILWALVFLSMLELALRLIKILPLALLAGAICTTLLLFPLHQVMYMLFLKNTLTLFERLMFMPFNLLASILLAFTFWLGLLISSGPRALNEPPAEPRVSRSFHMGVQFSTNGIALTLGFASIILMLAGVWKIRAASDATPIFLLLGVAGLLVLISIIAFCVLIYKMWGAIQDGYARTQPGSAVGLLFVPLFNLYWMFQVFPGFAKDYNAYVARHGLSLPPLSTSIFTVYVILCIMSVFPYLGLLVVPVAYAAMLLMIAKICDAVNALPIQAQPVAVNAPWAVPQQAGS